MPKPKQKATPKKNKFTIAVTILLVVALLLSLVIPLVSIILPADDDHDHYEEYQPYYDEDGQYYEYDEEHGHYHPASSIVTEPQGSVTRLSAPVYQGPQKYVDKGVDPVHISRSLPLEQRCNVDTAYRFFIYLMDKEGYTPNAIIGAMTYMMAEGGSYSDIMQGTYTYQTDWIYPGPSGAVMDKVEDNAAWIRWLNGAGFDRAVYDNGNCNIGLGLTQESDVWWYSRDNKTTANATALIQAAMAAGVPWQDPAFQVSYIINNKFSLPWAWDINDVPGVDPKYSTGVSALEWATRVWCGVGMPAYSSMTAPDTYPDGYASHTYGLRRATELYHKYSGTDPWFYKLEADWHNPFSGPEVKGVTPQGLLLARTALLLAADKKVIRISDHSYNAPEMVGESTLQYYRQACHSIGKNVLENGEYFASSDVGVTTAILLSGIDNDCRRMYVGSIRDYLEGTTKWEYLGKVSDNVLQPGDVLISPSPSDPDGEYTNTGRHMMIWVGEQVANERWPGTNVNVYEASFASVGTEYAYYPRMRQVTPDDASFGNCFVYRCVNPEFSPTYWEKFMFEYGSIFEELPKVYSVNR